MIYSDMFLSMFSAYKSEIGCTFPRADPRLVLQVLRQCATTMPTSQIQIEQVTWIPQPSLSKLIKKMIACKWLEASRRDHKTASKAVQITSSGQAILRDFEHACQKAVKKVSKAKASST